MGVSPTPDELTPSNTMAVIAVSVKVSPDTSCIVRTMRAASAAQMRSYSPTAAAKVSDSGTNSRRGTRTGPPGETTGGFELHAPTNKRAASRELRARSPARRSAEAMVGRSSQFAAFTQSSCDRELPHHPVLEVRLAVLLVGHEADGD